MLHLTLIRAYRKTDYTIGQLFAGGRFVCNTVEDTDRGINMYMDKTAIMKVKVPDKTAIPVGTYKLDVTPSPKFGRDLIEVQAVPGFSGIRIHRGNNADHSSGCIIPGLNNVKGGVTQSTKYEELLTSMVSAAIKNNETAYLTII